MHKYLPFLLLLFIFSCKSDKNSEDARLPISESETVVDDSNNDDLSAISAKDFRKFKVLDSKLITKAQIWSELGPQMEDFTEDDYNALKVWVMEEDIMALQRHIENGKLTYEELTKFYLYRIRKFDRENDLSLNSVISLNPNVF